MIKTEKYNKLYMDIAHRLSEMSYCKRKQVGCVVVKDDNIISMGWNGAPAGWDNNCEDAAYRTLPEVLHAEHNAIKKLKRAEIDCSQSTVYITCAPCKECAEMLLTANISHVVYCEVYRLLDGIEYLQENGILVTQI